MEITTILKNRKNVLKEAKEQLEKSFFDVDMIYEDLGDLVNDQYRAWYCKVIHRIGRDRVLVLASQARADGKDQSKLFSYLLRKEMQ